MLAWKGGMKGATGEGVMFAFISRARVTFQTVHAGGIQGAFANRRKAY